MSLPTRVGQTTNVRVAHKPHSKPYAYGSTEAAIGRAARDDYWGIDLDLTLDALGVGRVNHWPQPMLRDAWRDPRPKGSRMDHRKGIRTMTPAQADRLRSPWGRMLRASTASAKCFRRGIIPCFEAKGQDKRFFDPRWWASFKRRQAGRPFLVMALPGSKRAGIRKLRAAHEGGCRTVWLYRGPVPAEAKAFVTFVKRGRRFTRLNPDPA